MPRPLRRRLAISLAQQRVDLRAAMRIGVFGEHALQRRLADRARAFGRERAHMLGDVLPVARDQHFLVRRRGTARCPSHASVIRQAAAPAASNTRVAGEKPMSAMLSRATFSTASGVQLKALCSCVKTWPRCAHVGAASPCLPAVAADQELPLGQRRGGLEEELLDPRFAVGQPVAEERQIGGEARVRLDRDVRGRDRARCRSARSGAAPKPS